MVHSDPGSASATLKKRRGRRKERSLGKNGRDGGNNESRGFEGDKTGQ